MSDKLIDAIGGALEGLGKLNAAHKIVDPAVRTVAKDMGTAFVKSGVEKPEDFFSDDDPEYNRMIMKGVALANEINSEIDWAAVPAVVLKDALIALRAAAALAVIF